MVAAIAARSLQYFVLLHPFSRTYPSTACDAQDTRKERLQTLEREHAQQLADFEAQLEQTAEAAHQRVQASLQSDAIQRERDLMAAEQEVLRERQALLFQTGT